MKAASTPIYRWRIGEVEITRVLEFEAALFEPAVLHPEASPEIITRHQPWLETFANSPVMVIPAHFPTPTAGWIRSHDGSFRFHFDRLR